MPREDVTNTIASPIPKRVSWDGWECLNSISPFRAAVRCSPLSMRFFINHSRQNILSAEHMQSLFYFDLRSQYCMGRLSYWPKTPGYRNRLIFLPSVWLAMYHSLFSRRRTIVINTSLESSWAQNSNSSSTFTIEQELSEVRQVIVGAYSGANRFL